MNYSGPEISTIRTDDEALVEAGVQLVPVITRALFSAISDLGNAFGLTPAQVKVLLQLGMRRQMTVGEIAAALSCSMPAASELVDRLVDAGHLLRASDPADRRRVLIAATPASERISTHLHELREAQIRYALEQLEPEERPTFIKSLEALVAGLTQTPETPVHDGCHGAPVESVDSRSAATTSAADAARAPQLSTSSATENPLRSTPVRGND
jgi:DNA-binding MarR family transcriptional regulator